jgi:hypothetical protein
MKKSNKIKKNEVNAFLLDCRPDWSFWVCNGTVIHNLKELTSIVDSMDDGTFSYHNNKDRNDFAKWVRDVIGDHKLANSIEKELNKKKFTEKAKQRIKELEKK